MVHEADTHCAPLVIFLGLTPCPIPLNLIRRTVMTMTRMATPATATLIIMALRPPGLPTSGASVGRS